MLVAVLTAHPVRNDPERRSTTLINDAIREPNVVESRDRCYFVINPFYSILSDSESSMDTMTAAKPSETLEFHELSIGPWNVVVEKSIAEPFALAANALRFGKRGELAMLLGATPGSTGRGSTSILDLPGTTTRLHVRPLIHGGSLARITGARFLSLDRPLAELHTTAELTKRGAPVPGPGFVVGRRRGWFWQAALATVHVDGARDGVAFLAAQPDRATLLRAARAAGSAIRRLHDLGCRHADLHIKNLLIRESARREPGDEIGAELGNEIEVIIVDLDRARLGLEPTPKRRMLELMRLYRSLHKHGTRDAVQPRILAAFFAAYHGGDQQLRGQMLERRRTETWRSNAHTWFYRTR